MGGPRLRGRDRQVAELCAVLDGAATGGVLVVGEAGIGKSAVLGELGDAARRRGLTVLAAHPTSRETSLPYAGLRDVVGPVWPRVADALPAVQRGAMEAAMLLSEAPSGGQDRVAVGMAALGVLDRVVADGPVLVLLDDVHWLDPSSAQVLAFAARRVTAGRLMVAAATRLGPDGHLPSQVGDLLPAPVVEVTLGPLPSEVAEALVEENAGTDVPPAEVRRLAGLSGGNPLHALEIARARRRRDLLGHDGRSAAVPASLRELLDDRVDALPEDVVSTLTVVAALAEPDEQVLRRFSGDAEHHVEAARRAGVVRRERGEVVFTHPLLGERLYERLSPAGRRRLHARVAEVASTPTGRAWHRALSATGPDAAVAGRLDEAARAARSTGAPDVAARLGELALRLTPDDDMTAKVGRALAAAADLGLCGDVQAAAALLAPLLPRLPRGPLHARVEAALVWLGEGSQAEGRDRLRAAADEAAGDAGAEASVRYWLARTLLNTATLSEAEVQLRRVAALSAQAGDARLAVTAATELCFVVMARGEVADIDALAGASTALAGWDADCYDHPDLVLGWAACWSDDLERADELIGGLVGRADRSGQPATAAALRAHLAEVRIRQGRFAEAELLARAAQPMCEASGAEQLNLYVLGHALAHLGRHEQAEAAAGRGAAICRREGDRIFLMQNLLVLGFLAVSTRRWDDAARTLSQARELALRDGYRHPGLFRWDGDLAEALVAAGRAEDAEAVDEDLAARAQALGLEVPLAVAWRSEALRLAATGEPNAALRAARDAVAGLDPRRAPFDAARAQLVLGTVERRCRHRAAARRALAAALAEFSRMGAVAWAARAGEELGRVAGGAAGRELSDTERRVCALAAAGSRNREIAAELFISEKTVEAHLSSAYRKLGVRSRAQLARRLPPDPAPPAGSR